MHTAQATYDEGLLLFLERSGYPEETYRTRNTSAILGGNAEPAEHPKRNETVEPTYG